MEKVVMLDTRKLGGYMSFECGKDIASIIIRPSDEAPINSANVAPLGEEALPVFISDTEITLYTDADRIKIIGSLDHLFLRFSHLTDISGLRKWDVSEIADMSWMLNSCTSLTDLSPLKDWDVSNVSDMSGMFGGMESLKDLTPLSSWKPSNVISFGCMFQDCTSLTSLNGLGNFDFPRLQYMDGMFYDCESLTDVSSLKNWDVSKLANMEYMFMSCPKISNISVLKENWKLPEYIDADSVFDHT